LLVGELAVDSGKGLGPSLNIGLVLAVKVHLHDTLSVNLDASSLSNNFSGVDKIVQNSLVDGRQSTRTWAGAVGLMVAVVRLSKNSALGDNENVASRELLFQFAHELLVNLVESFSQFVRNIQENGLAAGTAVDFLGGSNVKIPEGCLELGGGHLKVEKLLSNRSFEFIGLSL